MRTADGATVDVVEDPATLPCHKAPATIGEAVRAAGKMSEQPPAPLSEHHALIAALERAARDPTVDVEKMERLFAMHERISARAAEVAFNDALAAMQPRLPIVDERGEILDKNQKVQSTYARWEDLNEAIRPILAEYGFALTFKPAKPENGHVATRAQLRHRAGHTEEAEVSLPIDVAPGRNSVQNVGSTLSYAKRYAAIAILNLLSRNDPTDDGGRAAGLSAQVQAAFAAINFCNTLEQMHDWRAKNEKALDDMQPISDRDKIVAHYSARWRRLSEERQRQQQGARP